MTPQYPTFSIIIPTYARPQQLAACLHSIAHLDYPRKFFEVIVVDDGSKTPPESAIASYQGQLDVALIKQPHAGPATARNTGVAQAKGEFLAFTDDDCAPAPDWLQTLAARFAHTPDRAVGGCILNALPNNLYSTASQTLISYLYSYYNADPNYARFFASNNLALSADRFRAVGGFDSDVIRAAAEDREFCDRWLHHGYHMTYAPEVIVYHAHALTFRTFWRQHFSYGRGAFYFRQARALRGRGPIRPEPLPFYLDLLCYRSSEMRGRRALSLSMLLGVSQIANAVGFLWEWGEKRRRG